MSENSNSLRNPFVSNTPQASPYKKQQLEYHRRGSVDDVTRRPTSSSSSLSSPGKHSRRPRSSLQRYANRYLPTRTDLDLRTIRSIGSSNATKNNTPVVPTSPTSPNSSCADHLEVRRERESMEKFDTILKNELFGDYLAKDRDISPERDSIYNSSTSRFTSPRKSLQASSIDQIRNTVNFSANSSPLKSASNIQFYRENQSDSDSDIGTDTDSDGANSSGLNNPYTSPSRRRHSNLFSNSIGTSVSLPVTPKKLTFSAGASTEEVGSTKRGASLLKYMTQSSTRPSTASVLHSHFESLDVSPIRRDSKKLLLSPVKQFKNISKVPYRVLDAPSLADDFYYSLVDWSSTDILAVALGKSVFLSEHQTGEVIHLCDTPNEYTSLSWMGAGSHLAIGQGNGIVEIYDVTKEKCIRTLSGHLDRVACLSWNNHILSSGSRDRTILHRDVRMADPFFEKIETHEQEICGLKWNTNDNKLASGGNDNMVFVYDGTSRTPFLSINEHKAAVKAMAWSPHKQGILATGGGTADRTLKMWNVNTSVKLNDVDTGSQVCNMVWSTNTDEIVTSHGYSKYNLTIWEASNLEPLAILKGHSFRVLHLTLSADGTTIVSGAGDETLRYWKLFEKQKRKATADSTILNALNQIR